MINEQKLKNLEVKVRGGGSLISHRPVFSPDGSQIHIIQSSSLLTYSTKTSSLLHRYTTPSSTPIANVQVQNSKILILTQTGQLLELQLPNKLISTRTVNLCPEGWVPITNFTNFLYPSSDYLEVEHFLALGYPQDSALPVLYSINPELQITKLCWSVVPGTHSIDISPSGRFVVAIQDSTLFCKDMSDMKHCKWHSSGTRKLTCVAIHPTETFVCATGDDSGRVVIWYNVMVDKSPAKTQFHWHTLPVTDICFSPEGTNLYSGGGECALVKWDITQNSKRVLPRMGLPIVHLTCSSDGEYVSVSHEDNLVQIVDPYNKIVGVVRNLSRGGGFSSVVVEPKSGTIVLNGRPGWLQFYDYFRDSFVCDIDVCQLNYVTAEREGAIPNYTVKFVGFSGDGVWMGTGEERDGEGFRVKFWKRDHVKGVWVLNTCVEGVEGLKCLRLSSNGGITCSGKDLKFWGVAEIDSCVGCTEYWVCDRVVGYKGLNCECGCFSVDGSIVAAGFGRIVTLWGSSGEFRLSLCNSRLGDVKGVEFGGGSVGHLLLSFGVDYVAVWDVISGLLSWVVPVSLDCVGVDVSGVVCGGKGRDLILFELCSSEVLRVYENCSKSNVCGVGWVGIRRGKEVVFVNKSDEVCGLGEKGGKVEEVFVKEDKSGLTGFGVMVAEKVVGEGVKEDWGGEGIDTQAGYAVLREIMDCSPHTMPSVKYYCTQLLRTLSTQVNEHERLAQIEEVVRSQGKKYVDQTPPNLVTDKVNVTSVDSFSADLDEIAGEDVTWIGCLFKD